MSDTGVHVSVRARARKTSFTEASDAGHCRWAPLVQLVTEKPAAGNGGEQPPTCVCARA